MATATTPATPDPTLDKISLSSIQTALRSARDLFRGGNAWAKGALKSRRYDTGKLEYCAVGAIYEALDLFGKTFTPGPPANGCGCGDWDCYQCEVYYSYEAVVDDDEACPREAAPAIIALANAILDELPLSTTRYVLSKGQEEWDAAKSTVESWNDRQNSKVYVPGHGYVDKLGLQTTEFDEVYDLFTKVAKAPSNYLEV